MIIKAIKLTAGERRRSALVAAGVAPSSFGHRKAGNVHRDRRAAERRGERKHRTPWH